MEASQGQYPRKRHMYKDLVTRPAGFPPPTADLFETLSVYPSFHSISSIFFQSASRKRSQACYYIRILKSSGTKRRLEMPKIQTAGRRVQVSLPHLRWSLYTGSASSDILSGPKKSIIAEKDVEWQGRQTGQLTILGIDKSHGREMPRQSLDLIHHHQFASESYCSLSNRTPLLAISRSISAEWTEDWLVHQIEEDCHGPSQLMARARSVVALKVNFDECHTRIIPGTLSRWSKDCMYPNPSARGNLDTEQGLDLVGIGSWV